MSLLAYRLGRKRRRRRGDGGRLSLTHERRFLDLPHCGVARMTLARFFSLAQWAVVSALFLPLALGHAAGPGDVLLVPRKAFFGNPEKARARLSPDGKRLAFLAPVEGVLNVWVSSDDDPAKAKPVTFDKHRGVMDYSWAFTSQHILYSQDKNGDEDNHVYCIRLDT